MNSIKNIFTIAAGVLGAIVLTPLIAFFGLVMLGLTFGVSLLATGVVAASVYKAQQAAEQENTQATYPSEENVAS